MVPARSTEENYRIAAEAKAPLHFQLKRLIRLCTQAPRLECCFETPLAFGRTQLAARQYWQILLRRGWAKPSASARLPHVLPSPRGIPAKPCVDRFPSFSGEPTASALDASPTPRRPEPQLLLDEP